MITKKTLLVLGAGASIPYGLLSGTQLTKSLCQWAWQTPGENVAKLFVACGSSADELQQFSRALHRSMLPSVDTFLAHRPVMSQIGKLAIAFGLGSLESNDDEHWFDRDDDWYRHLWNRLRAGANDNPHAILNNALRIITFNYDRSLEFALYRAIRYTYGIAEGPAQEILNKLAIRHVYGELGKFHHLGIDGGGRHYVPISKAHELQLAADGIRTIPEARADGALFRQLQEWFYWAEDVVYMGFSFDELNVERLAFNAVIELKYERAKERGLNIRMPRIVACTHGMTDAEVEAARLRTCPSEKWFPIGKPNLQFLRNVDLLG